MPVSGIFMLEAGSIGLRRTDDEGIHFCWPLAQTMHLVGVAIEKGEGEGDAASKDLQTVKAKVVFNYYVRQHASVTV